MIPVVFVYDPVAHNHKNNLQMMLYDKMDILHIFELLAWDSPKYPFFYEQKFSSINLSI